MLFGKDKNKTTGGNSKPYSLKPCIICRSTGKVNCNSCGGDGKIFWPGVNGKNYPCPECKGTGQVDCPVCKGRGYN